MKKPIIFSVFFFIITAISSFGQDGGVWIEEVVDPDTGLRKGIIEFNDELYGVYPNRNLSGIDFTGIDLSRADLRGSNLMGTVLSGAILDGADLSKTDLTDSDLRITSLINTNLSNSNLSNTKLFFSNLSNANLNNANLNKSDLNFANLNEANLNEANLTGANLNGANLEGANLERATLTEVNLNATIFNNINARVAALEEQLASVTLQRDLAITERDARPTLEAVRDARTGSVVLNVDPDGDNITLALTIEQSDNLIEWTKLDGEMTRTIPIPDGKKFYRFALDK